MNKNDKSLSNLRKIKRRYKYRTVIKYIYTGNVFIYICIYIYNYTYICNYI